MAPSRPFWKGRRGPRGSFHHYRGKHIRSEFGSIAYRNRGMTPRTAAAATTTSSKIRSWIVEIMSPPAGADGGRRAETPFYRRGSRHRGFLSALDGGLGSIIACRQFVAPTQAQQ